MKLSRRRICGMLGVVGSVVAVKPVLAFKLSIPKLGGGGGDVDVGSLKKLLAAAAKADAKMNAYFLIAVGKKEEADKFLAAAEAMSEDTVDKEYDKLNDLKDEHPMKADDLENFKPSKEANEALTSGNAMGSVALINYILVLPQIKSGIDAIKSNPMNIGLLPTLTQAISAIPKGITTITKMVKTSRAIAKKNNIPVKSKDEVAKLSESVGGSGDTSGLPE